MIIRVYSKLEPGKLLHMVVKDIPKGRTNLCLDEQFIQCAALKLPKGTTFRPHQHIWKKVGKVFPQESWCILSGKAKIIMYDTDGTLLGEEIISKGQISFSFFGGHNYEVLTDNFYCAEYKVGPYRGVEADKIFI